MVSISFLLISVGGCCFPVDRLNQICLKIFINMFTVLVLLNATFKIIKSTLESVDLVYLVAIEGMLFSNGDVLFVFKPNVTDKCCTACF